MKVVAQVRGNETSWDALVAVAQVMDAGRWDSAWAFDQFVPPLAFMDGSGDCLEGWMTLAGRGAIAVAKAALSVASAHGSRALGTRVPYGEKPSNFFTYALSDIV